MKLILIVFAAFLMQIKSDPIPMETTTVNADSTNKSVIDSNLTDATIVTSTESNKDEKIPKDKNNEKKLPVNSENKLMDLENQPPTMTESETESSSKTIRSAETLGTYTSPLALHFANQRPVEVQPYEVYRPTRSCPCSCQPPSPPPICIPAPHSYAPPQTPPVPANYIIPAPNHKYRMADDDNDELVPDSLTEEAQARSAYANGPYAAPQQSYLQPSYPAPQPAYYQPKPAYAAPIPSYEAPKPSYATPKPYVAPQPSYQMPPPSYPAHVYSHPSPPPPASCGQNLLIGCAPTVSNVPCSAYKNSPQLY